MVGTLTEVNVVFICPKSDVNWLESRANVSLTRPGALEAP